MPKSKTTDLEHVDPATLVAWERNPRVNDHAVAAVARSIERFGFGAPVVARPSDRRILAGHTRIKAALSLGIAKIPVRWLELADGEADAYSLADNRLGELAEFDEAGLAEILRGFGGSSTDIAGLGFTDYDLATLGLIEPSSVPVNSPEGVFVGMPEFVSGDLSPWRTVHVHFAQAEDLAAFAALIGQRITEHTRAIWFPPAAIGHFSDRAYVDEVTDE